MKAIYTLALITVGVVFTNSTPRRASAARNNPFQLFNPFAPVRYGDGGANTVRNVTTGRFEGLKLLAIHF